MNEMDNDDLLINGDGNQDVSGDTDNLEQNESQDMTDNAEYAPEETKEESKPKSGFFGKKSNTKEDKLKEEVATLKEEKKELNDKFLRLYSEFDNYKKRTQKEKIDLIGTASERVIKEILPVLDDFERAIDANAKTDDINQVKEGFELIYHKFLQILKMNNVEEIPAKGEMFDTDYHEAIAHVPAPEEEKGKVIDVSQKGYKIKDKVIRYPKVIVGN